MASRMMTMGKGSFSEEEQGWQFSVWPYILAGSIAFLYVIFASLVIPRTVSEMVTPAVFLLVTLLCGGTLFLFLLMTHYRRQNSLLELALERESKVKADTQKKLEASELALLSEPQILVRYNGVGKAVILSSTLEVEEVLGLSNEAVINFGQWLGVESTEDLENSLHGLEEEGEEFDLIVQTKKGYVLEAVGRISGDQALVKIRHLAGAGAVQQQLKDELDNMLGELMAARQLLDAMPMPAWFKSEDNRLTWVNEAYARAVGVRDKSLVISVNAELLEQRHIETISATLKQGKTFHTKTRMILGGDHRFFDLIVLPNDKKSAGIAIDVEDETNASENLQRHLQAFDDTLERVATAVVVFDAKRNLQYYNQAYMDLWEFDRSWLETSPTDNEILDRLRMNRQLPEQSDYHNWKNTLLSLSETGPSYEDWWYLRDGRILYVTGKLGPDRSITYCFENMTEQYDLESKYNALIRMQSATLNALNEGVAVFASNGRLKLSNPAFARLWNLSPSLLEETPHIDQVIAACQPLYTNNNFWDRVLEAVTVLDDSREYFTDKLTRVDGMVLANHVEPLPNGATMITFHDITELEKTAQILAERNDALQSADKLKNSFISNVSYDLRTPLTAIIGFTEMLMHAGQLNLGEGKQKEYLRDIRHSGQILEASINDILVLASIDAGKLELELGDVQVTDVLTAVLAQFRDIILKKQIEIVADLDPKECQTFVADQKRVHQILAKILSNAVAYTPQGGTIRLGCSRVRDEIMFEITDSGKGIAKEKLERVFDRFGNSFDTVRNGNAEGGVGIGLAVARELVELHGGVVHIASREGRGTMVSVSFPTDVSQKLQEGDNVKMIGRKDPEISDRFQKSSEKPISQKALRA